MFLLPPLGVLACPAQAFSSVDSPCVIDCAPANILDAWAGFLLASVFPSNVSQNSARERGCS